MNFEEFAKYMKEYAEKRIKEKLDREDVRINICPVNKVNNNYLGMRVEGEGIYSGATVNLDQFYRAYTEEYVRLDILAHKAVEILSEKIQDVDVRKLLNYNYVKDRLFIRICDQAKNNELLKSVPHHRKAGLAITYHILVADTDRGPATTIVRNDMLNIYGIDARQLHEDAMRSAQMIAPLQIASMHNVMLEQMMEEGVDPEFIDLMREATTGNPMDRALIVKTEGDLSEASAVFYPEVLDDLSKQLGTDLIILPSSVFEVIVLPDDGNMNFNELKDLVQSVNENEVMPEERLSYDVFHYDAKEKVFEKAEDFSARKSEKESVMDKMRDKRKQVMILFPDKKGPGKDMVPDR